nr:MAG TPA: hypothetical protein [Caudoviricetes sp.]
MSYSISFQHMKERKKKRCDMKRYLFRYRPIR